MRLVFWTDQQEAGGGGNQLSSSQVETRQFQLTSESMKISIKTLRAQPRMSN